MLASSQDFALRLEATVPVAFTAQQHTISCIRLQFSNALLLSCQEKMNTLHFLQFSFPTNSFSHLYSPACEALTYTYMVLIQSINFCPLSWHANFNFSVSYSCLDAGQISKLSSSTAVLFQMRNVFFSRFFQT